MFWLVGASDASAAAPAFAQVSGSPFTTLGSAGMAYSPNGSMVVEADQDDNELVMYSVAADGALSQLSTASTAGLAAVTFNPAGTLVAVAGSGNLSIFKVGSGRTLAQVTEPSFNVSGARQPTRVTRSAVSAPARRSKRRESI
jgi:WD40 repeat protein